MSILQIYLIGCIISTFISLTVSYLDWREGHNFYLSDLFQYTAMAFLSWLSIIFCIVMGIVELIEWRFEMLIIKGKDH